jgi:hypothetical protein
MARAVLLAFDQSPGWRTPAELNRELMLYLIAEYGRGRQCILIVDEAQNLSIAALLELFALSNAVCDRVLLLQIVLVGQARLLETLQDPSLSRLAERIPLSHRLSALSFAECRGYIEHRLAIAGARRPLFHEEAVAAIFYFSGGVPRLVNTLCDLALVYAYAEDQEVVGLDIVRRTVVDRKTTGLAAFAHMDIVGEPNLETEIAALLAPVNRFADAEPESIGAVPDTSGQDAAPEGVPQDGLAQEAPIEPVIPKEIGPIAEASGSIVIASEDTESDRDFIGSGEIILLDTDRAQSSPQAAIDNPTASAIQLEPIVAVPVQWPPIPGRKAGALFERPKRFDKKTAEELRQTSFQRRRFLPLD